MQNSYRKVIAILLLTVPAALHGSGSRSSFLYHGPSVAAYGRGETGAALPDDTASSHFNPSLLASSLNPTSRSVSFVHHALIDGTMYNYLGMFYATRNTTAIGISAINLRSGDVDIRRTITDTATTIHTNQWAYQLTAAKQFKVLSNASIGVGLKYIVEDLYEAKGSGQGVDIGISKVFSGPSLFGNRSTIHTGAAAINIVSPRVKLISEDEVFEPSFRLGASFSLPIIFHLRSFDSLALSVDMVTHDDIIDYCSGIEYSLSGQYHLRGGYYRDHATAGIGGHIDGLSLEYAIDLNPLSPINRFGISYSWASVPDTSDKQKEVSRKDPFLMKEAKRSLREAQRLKARQDKEIQPLVRTAIKEYRHKQYLKAGDKLRDIMLRYPEYMIARVYYEKINTEMNATVKDDNNAGFEKLSYAKGYLYYRNQDFAGALVEWEKVLQFNPERQELTQYIADVKKYLKDLQRKNEEKETAEKIQAAFIDAVTDFDNRRWIVTIRKMEKVQEMCKANVFPASLEWYNSAQEYINRAIQELSRTIVRPTVIKASMAAADQSQLEVDSEGADRKYNEGLILYAQGKTSDAIHAWEIALRLNPEHVKAHKALIKAREELQP